ncbi:MAG: 3'-5' exonuclease [Candidatus Freyarchaeota archaeon]
MSLTPGRKNAVRLMNLHKAKGLEASFVFLANPVGVKRHKTEKHIIRKRMTAEGYFLCISKTGMYQWKVLSQQTGMYQWKVLSQPLGWEEKAEEERRYEEAEEQRLMYVASTRAKDCLIVSTYEGALGERRAWSSLDDCLQDVPELETPDVQAVQTRKKLRLEKKEWEEAKQEIGERQDIVAVPGYAVESVTSLAKKDLEVPEWKRGSYGMAWGRTVHKMLEIVGRGNGKDMNLDLLAKNVLTTEEISLDKKGELVRLIQSIVESDFWERVKKAERKLFEVPFSILTDKEILPTILSGAIDLAFLERGGWVIADFKTDDVKDNLQSFVDYYTPQVKIYCRYWTEITQQPIKEAGLYFTSVNKWIKVKLS